MPEPSTATKATLQLLRMAALLSDELDDELERASGLGLSEILVIIQILFSDQRLKMTELAETLVVTRGGVTRIVDRLVEGGYLDRVPSEEDRRVVYAEVTPAGAALIAEHQPVFEAVAHRRVGAMLDGDSLERMHGILHVLTCENPGWEPPVPPAGSPAA